MSKTQDVPITEQEIAGYLRDGCACLRGVIAEKWIGLLRTGLERNIANPTKHFRDLSGSTDSGGFITDMWAWREVEEYETFVRQSNIGELGGRLNRSRRVNFLEDNFFVKRAGLAAPTPWHQDLPYYDLAGSMWSFWVPLDPHTKIDCLELVVGSHLWGKTFLPVDFTVNSQGRNDDSPPRRTLPPGMETVPDIDANRSDYDIRSWDLDVGDCLIFDARTLHGTQGSINSAGGRRISFRFVGDDARYRATEYPWAELGGDHGLSDGASLECDAFPTVWSL